MDRVIRALCDLPHGEMVEDEATGEYAVPGGLPATEAVFGIFRELGYKMGEIGIDKEHYRRTFDAESDSQFFVVGVWHLDDELVVDLAAPLGCLLIPGGRKDCKAAMGEVFARLAADERFRDVTWAD